MIYKGTNNEFIQLQEIKEGDVISFDRELAFPLLFVWVRGKNSAIIHEGIKIHLANYTILCLSVFQQIEFCKLETAWFIKFNK
jgi:hypothetical protein